MNNIITTAVCIAALALLPAGVASQSVAPKNNVDLEMPEELKQECLRVGCYVLTEEQLQEYTQYVLQQGYQAGYLQCRKESRI